MNSKIKKILEKLESSGFEAYVVGGYVRDTLLGIKTTDVDICTNALPKDIIKIFNSKGSRFSCGSISLTYDIYTFDITTYRNESNYNKRIPLNIEYIDDLIIDLKRRDFTINALCMNKEGKIIDHLNGIIDLNNKIIKTIGNTDKKLTEDPLRILRAIRFSITLDFKLDDEILKFIKTKKHLIKTLSYNRRQEELNRIISSKNSQEGLKLLKKLNLLEELEINYNDIVATKDVLGIWAQIDFGPNYNFNKSSKDTINKIREILSNGIIDNNILYKYDLYISMVAGEILGIDLQTINKMYSKLKINSQKDLEITSEEIFDLLRMKPSNKIKAINEDLIDNVLNHGLKNKKEVLKKYLLEKWE